MGEADIRNVAQVSKVLGGATGLFTSPLRSKMFLMALMATLAGGGFLAASEVRGDAESPVWAGYALRLGASYVAAFMFAYLIRRAVLFALLVGGGLIAAAVFVNKLGLGISQDDLSELNAQVHKGAEAIQSNADAAWTQLKSHLPSGGAAGVGFFRGVRHAPLHPTAPSLPQATEA